MPRVHDPNQLDLQMKLLSNVVFDLDGTLCDDSWRRSFITPIGCGKKQWDRYHKESIHDMPNHNIVVMYQNFYHCGLGMIICTGRPAKYRPETIQWLAKHGLGFNLLLMRPDNDYSPAALLKPRLLSDAGYSPREILFVIDDSDSVIGKLRELNYTALHHTKEK
jgi:hypothetical protein